MKILLTKNSTLVLFATLLFIIAFVWRITYIESIPANINPDAVNNLQTYLQFKHQPQFSLFDLNWNGAPAFNTYVIGFFWEIFNQSIFGLRFAPALFSSLAVGSTFLLLYLLTRTYTISFIASLALSSNPLFLNFSRDGWENVFNSLFLNFLLLGIILYFYKRREKIGLALIIIGSTLGFYGYHPGKFLIVIALVVFSIHLLVFRNWKRDFLSLLIILSLFSILALPQIVNTLQHPEKAFGRLKVVSIFSQDNPYIEFKKNIASNLKGLLLFDINTFIGTPYNTRYLPLNKSPINLFFLPFYIIGLLISLKKYPYLIIAFSISVFPQQLFSTWTPDAARLVHTIPLFYAFIGIGIFLTYKIAQKLLRSRLKLTTAFLLAISIAVIAVTVIDAKNYLCWIQNPQTLSFRNPAVDNNLYFLWKQSVKANISNGGSGINRQEWENMLLTQNIVSQNYGVLGANTAKNTVFFSCNYQ